MTQLISKICCVGITFFFFLACIPVSSYALCQATLQWDACSPVPEGYIIYGRAEGEAYNYDEPWWSGDTSFTACKIDELDENTNYYFVVRAYVGTNLSADSNEVSFTCTNTESDTNSLQSNSNTTPDATQSDTMEGSSSLTSDTGSTNSTSSSGKSSSSGCFIQSLFGFMD